MSVWTSSGTSDALTRPAACPGTADTAAAPGTGTLDPIPPIEYHRHLGGGYWEQDGRFAGYDGFAWYCCFVLVPQAWAGKDLTLNVTALDNSHESYFNGEKVGGAGQLPPNYVNGLDTEKPCTVPAKLVRPGQWNFVAVRVYDAGRAGGFRDGAPVLSVGNEAMKLDGRWLFNTGDNREWVKWPEGDGMPDTAVFGKAEPAPQPAPR